jgi:hypothetical protein
MGDFMAVAWCYIDWLLGWADKLDAGALDQEVIAANSKEKRGANQGK